MLASFILDWRPLVKFNGRKSSLDVGLGASVGNSIFYPQSVKWCDKIYLYLLTRIYLLTYFYTKAVNTSKFYPTI